MIWGSGPNAGLGIFPRYAILLSVTIGFLVSLVGASLLYVVYQSNERQIADTNALQLRLVQARVASLFDNIEAQLRVISAIPWDTANLTIDDRVTEFRRALSLFPTLIELRLTNESGVELLSVGRSQPVRLGRGLISDIAIAQLATQTKDPVFSRVGWQPGKMQPYVDIAIADKGSSKQISIARISLQSLSELLAQLAAEQSGSAYIIEKGGVVVAHSDRTVVLKPTPLTNGTTLGAAEVDRQLQGTTSGRNTIERDGVAIISNWGKLGKTDWLLFLEQEQRVAMAPVRRALLLSCLLLAFSLLAALAISYFLARRMSLPIVELSKSARRLAKGELSHRIVAAQSKEFAYVATSFNYMANELETLTSDLATRIAQVTSELETEFALRETKSKELVKLEERSRMMRDFHDSVGGHLVGILGAAKLGQMKPDLIASMVQDALVDFRICIDSLAPIEPDLGIVLANLRHRLEPRLAASHIELRWPLSNLPERLNLSQEQIFHVQRIVVEAITNIQKHAINVTYVSVMITWDEAAQYVRIVITDNGQSEVATSILGKLDVLQTRGIANLRTRSKALNAEILFSSATGVGLEERGLQVTLILPCRILP